MTFDEALAHIHDRIGRCVIVSVRGDWDIGPHAAMAATGILRAVPNAAIPTFSFDGAPDVRVNIDGSQFHGARVDGEQLTVSLGDEVQITFKPCSDRPRLSVQDSKANRSGSV